MLTVSTNPRNDLVPSGSGAELLSHVDLLRESVTSSPSPSARLDAIVVPASRGASVLDSSIALSTRLDVLLVVLCSQKTHGDEVAARVAGTPGARALIVDVPDGYSHPIFPTRTAAQRFREANAFRSSDLSVKRNVGLLLARLHGWRKILFLDDDIRLSVTGPQAGIDLDAIGCLVAALDDSQMAGMACHSFPDNSVVCHARRLSGRPQGNFISGAVLGVNCSDIPLPFFPDIYNEDWFFFSRSAAERELRLAGDAVQKAYDPYESQSKACEQEFGDLLAEGLYALFENQSAEMKFADRLAAATQSYWDGFIKARAYGLHETMARLASPAGSVADCAERAAAIGCLEAAALQLRSISPHVCAAFIEAWQADLACWGTASQGINSVRDIGNALYYLRLPARQVEDKSVRMINSRRPGQPETHLQLPRAGRVIADRLPRAGQVEPELEVGVLGRVVAVQDPEKQFVGAVGAGAGSQLADQ
jgi:hypothetical protein